MPMCVEGFISNHVHPLRPCVVPALSYVASAFHVICHDAWRIGWQLQHHQGAPEGDLDWSRPSSFDNEQRALSELSEALQVRLNGTEVSS